MKVAARVFLLVLAITAWALIAIATLWTPSAHAAGALTASTRPVTPNTKCGAPGVGYNSDGNVVAGSVIYPDSHSGRRVNAAGVWEICQLPFDCLAYTVPVPTNKIGYRLRPNALPGEYFDPKDQRTLIVVGPKGPTDWRGHLVYKCVTGGIRTVTGGWTLVESTFR